MIICNLPNQKRPSTSRWNNSQGATSQYLSGQMSTLFTSSSDESDDCDNFSDCNNKSGWGENQSTGEESDCVSESDKGDGNSSSGGDFPECQELAEDIIAEQNIEPKNTLCVCVKATADDVVIMTLSLGLRHNLSWVAQVDVLNMVNTIYDDNKVPSSKFLYLRQIGNTTSMKYHFFCENCNRYLGERGLLTELAVNCECGQIINPKDTKFLCVSWHTRSVESTIKGYIRCGFNFFLSVQQVKRVSR